MKTTLFLLHEKQNWRNDNIPISAQENDELITFS